MRTASRALDGLAVAMKWITWVLVALYGAAVASPLVVFGFSDDSIVLAAALAMGIPAAVFCLYLFGRMVAHALSPAAEAILGLVELVWRIGRALLRR